MERARVYAAIAAERLAIADLIGDLDEVQLSTPSLCGDWDVKTVGAHLASVLQSGTFRISLLGLRHGGANGAMAELARHEAANSAAEIAAHLRALADHTYFRPPPQAAGLLAEVLCHSGDVRIPLGLPFSPSPDLVSVAMGFMTGPVPLGMVPLRRLRGIRFCANDIDAHWGRGAEIHGSGALLMMAAVGRLPALDGLSGPGVTVLRKRISGP